MNSLSKKIYLELQMPGENNTTSDKDRIINFLEQEYENVVMPYKIIKTLYPPMS